MTSPEPITADTALRLLAERRRRQVLHQLADADSHPLTIDRLVDSIPVAGDSDTDSTGEKLTIQLHHVHLPTLQEAGVIEYDPRRGTVRRGPQFQDTFALYRAIHDHREGGVELDRHR